MKALRINPLVVTDLKNIKEFIAEDNPDMALKILREIYSQFESIQQFPDLGTKLQKRVSFKTDYKYLVFNNYVILYKEEKAYIEIYRVMNRFQDITSIFE